MGILSKRSKFAQNPIREDDNTADKLARKGRKIIKLSTGDPPAYIPTPKYIVDAYIDALKNGKTGYSRSEGIYEMINAVIGRYKRMYGVNLNENDVVSTQGISEGLHIMNSALVNDGDYAITFKPYFPAYASNLYLSGGRFIFQQYNESDRWNIDADAASRSIAKIRKTSRGKHLKYLLLANPNNPTGTVLHRPALEEIVEIANNNDLLLISDEIYDEIVYNGAKFTSMSKLAKGIPHVILYGASKNYQATGFRIGFMIVPESDRVSAKVKETFADYARSRLSINTPAQYAVAEAMNNVKEHRRAIKNLVKIVSQRTNYAVDKLERNTYMSTVRPNGAFYILPKVDMKELKLKNDAEFVSKLLMEENIQIIRGSGFGAPGHIRIVSLAPKEILGYAIDRINAFCERHAKR